MTQALSKSLQKLYTSIAHCDQHADLIMMTAKACGVKLEEIVYDAAAHSLKVEGGATFPVLETEEGQILSQTSAILMYIAYGHAMLGKSAIEQAQVSQWVNYIRQETWPLAKGYSAFVFG